MSSKRPYQCPETKGYFRSKKEHDSSIEHMKLYHIYEYYKKEEEKVKK
jgi:hypothetical protein